MRNRKLNLKRESLNDLTTSELVSVAGGQALTHATCGITDGCGHGPSFDKPCPTLPLYPCLAPFVASTLIDCVS